jgi:hypothetical protein
LGNKSFFNLRGGRLFRNGLLYKAFPIKQLEIGVGVRPTVEEV